MFNGILITKDESGYRAAVAQMDEAQLPAGDVSVRVSHSTLNYKDGLAITGRSPVVRSFPMVPGIDFAGTVLESQHPRWAVGDKVLLNGFGVGETHWGGLAQLARVKGDWLVALPKVFSARDAMAIGTAGYTAMLCVQALQQHWAAAGVSPGSGEVLVTGSRDTTLMVWGGAPSRKTRGKVREGKRRAAGSSAATAGAHAPLRLALPSRGGAWAGC